MVTTPNPEYPKGALTGVAGSSARALQSVTQQDAINSLRAPVDESFSWFRGGVQKLINNMFSDIASAFRGNYRGTNEYLLSYQDGQVSLNNRTDLLDSLLNYGSASTPPGSGDAMKGSGKIPFTHQIGAMRGVSIRDGRLILGSKGLWDLRAMVTVSWIVGNNNIQAYLRVLRPDGSEFSRQAYFHQGAPTETLTLVSSVMVPGPGYQVEVWGAADANRGWWTGPTWTRLTAQQISSSTEGGTGGEDSAVGSNEQSDPVVNPGGPIGSI
ncbi:hypothetical protein ACEN2A_08445 [Corynebacterium auriscanis]|uniref:hypothetical protein n=1 Tax=Corynebacterium auriscanis TaxID=99807 RepID=UPI003CEA95C1